MREDLMKCVFLHFLANRYSNRIVMDVCGCFSWSSKFNFFLPESPGQWHSLAAVASASFPKRNKNGIKIWPQWDSCRTWQAAPQATIVEIKQILEQSCIGEREIDSYLATTDIAEHAIWIWTPLPNFWTSANGISKLLFPQIAKEWLKRSWSVKLYTILKWNGDNILTLSISRLWI